MKDQLIQIRISKADKDALAAVAEQLDIPAAQIVREAVKERISDLKSNTKNQVEFIQTETALAE
jgi:predicted DNA-binding protein